MKEKKAHLGRSTSSGRLLAWSQSRFGTIPNCERAWAAVTPLCTHSLALRFPGLSCESKGDYRSAYAFPKTNCKLASDDRQKPRIACMHVGRGVCTIYRVEFHSLERVFRCCCSAHTRRVSNMTSDDFLNMHDNKVVLHE